ncbi:hypothetical protein Droror1_Dr00023396 [Drosera rotundifolia]
MTDNTALLTLEHTVITIDSPTIFIVDASVVNNYTNIDINESPTIAAVATLALVTADSAIAYDAAIPPSLSTSPPPSAALSLPSPPPDLTSPLILLLPSSTRLSTPDVHGWLHSELFVEQTGPFLLSLRASPMGLEKIERDEE